MTVAGVVKAMSAESAQRAALGAGAIIIDTIIGMADSLGLEAMAEGVETSEQRDFLYAHGCRLFQGYLFSRPASLAEFELQLDAITVTPRAEVTFSI